MNSQGPPSPQSRPPTTDPQHSQELDNLKVSKIVYPDPGLGCILDVGKDDCSTL